MTIDELAVYLDQHVSPEATEVLVDCARVMCESGLTSHLDDLDDIIAVEDNFGRDATVARVAAYLEDTLEACITQFGITLHQGIDVNLRHMTALQRGINQITNYEDVETIEAYCLSEEDPETRLADMLELLTEYTWADYLAFVKEVNPSLFKRILEQITKPDELDEIDNQDNAILIRTKSLLLKVQKPWLIDEIEDGVTLGLPLEPMLLRFKARYDAELAQTMEWNRKPQLLAEQYLLYVLASNVPDDKLLEASQTQAESVIHHMPTLSGVLRHCQQLLSQVPSQ